jgi:cytochrome b subunit of formate dehydrogenase
MNKTILNYWIDVGLFITFFLVTATGIIKWPSLARKLLHWPLREISLIHDWSGIVMAALVIVHLILHWNWIVNVTKNLILKKRNKK